MPSLPCTSSVPVPLTAQRERCVSRAWILCSHAVFRIQHISILTCHSLVYSVLGSSGGFANTARSCPARPLLFQTTTLCISPSSLRFLSPILPGLCICCQLYEPYGASVTWAGDALAWAQGLPTWAWQREEIRAGLSRPITFFSG